MCSSSTIILSFLFPFFFVKQLILIINDGCGAQTKKIDSDQMGPLIKFRYVVVVNTIFSGNHSYMNYDHFVVPTNM